VVREWVEVPVREHNAVAKEEVCHEAGVAEKRNPVYNILHERRKGGSGDQGVSLPAYRA
jgi:hypothetical protein